MKRVIISDTHIGSKYYKEEELLSFLRSVEYDELILAGDIIDFIRVPVFTARAAEIINAINYEKPVYYIIGNHDHPLKGFVGKGLFGISFVDKYEFEEGGRKFRVVHGDEYDSSLVHHNFFMSMISIVQDAIERTFDVDLSTMWTDYKIKVRKLRRVWDILKWNEDVDVFIMGHSHTPEVIIWVDGKGSIKTYANIGDWVSNTSYLIIEDGVVRLNFWKTENAGEIDVEDSGNKFINK